MIDIAASADQPRDERGRWTPDLTGRVARCYCGREEPSSTSLAFFEYCGEGSQEADRCAECGFARCVHDLDYRMTLVANRGRTEPKPLLRGLNGQIFDEPHLVHVPQGDIGHDRYYDGCRGWD